MSGQKILDGLKDAVDGNFARVTIEGQTWIRADLWRPDIINHVKATERERCAKAASACANTRQAADAIRALD